MKKRNKKYNPHKISHLIGRKKSEIHHLWMRYDNDVVDKITDDWVADHPNEDVPTRLLYPHIQGDLIIAIKHRLIDMVQKWNLKMILSIRKPDDIETEEVELHFDLPKCSLAAIKVGDENIKIDRGHGVKTRWKGIDQEVHDALKPLEDEGYINESTLAYVTCDTAFLSKEAYSFFLQEIALRLTLGEMVGYRHA